MVSFDVRMLLRDFSVWVGPLQTFYVDTYGVGRLCWMLHHVGRRWGDVQFADTYLDILCLDILGDRFETGGLTVARRISSCI